MDSRFKIWGRRHGEAKAKEEIEHYRHMTIERRLAIFFEVNDLAWKLFLANGQKERALELRDDLPPSSKHHLQRLRGNYSWHPR